MSEMEQAGKVGRRMDNLRNVAAKAWPDGVIIGFCLKCGKTRSYDWEAVAKMLAKGFPRHCGQRIDLK